MRQLVQWLFGDNNLVPFHLWWRQILLKSEKVYGYFVQDCTSIFLVFSDPGIQYLWQGEISACKVLVSIKVVPVKNDYFLHAKFELQIYQQINRFLYWYSFYWKKFGTCISHKPIARLIPTWIWYDLLTLSQILPSNHQLLNSFNFVSLK